MTSLNSLRRLALLALLLLSAFAPVTTLARLATDAPRPIAFPRDDGPHDADIEWWYYTGHLFTESGDRFGFEFVVFKGKRDDVTGYASHFAITDSSAGLFRYDQRIAFAPADAHDERETGFDLTVVDWNVRGLGGDDHLEAAMADYAIDLDLTSEKSPVLHDGDGYLDFGNGQTSFYYSRTRLSVEGTLTVGGIEQSVTGEAWFDHQWGDFTTYLAGGWDWYSIQLENKTEVMLYVTRVEEGAPPAIAGSYIDESGNLTPLTSSEFAIEPLAEWTSPRSGETYPSGWRFTAERLGLDLVLTPVLADQELDTTASTGITYWEGEITVSGTSNDAPITGLGYVELTGYAPVAPISATPTQ